MNPIEIFLSLSALILIIVVAFWIGYGICEEEMHKKTIEKGFARYNERTGEFEWSTCVSSEKFHTPLRERVDW
jgi:hypothetical protein